MAIGYACITLGVPAARMRSVTKRFASPEVLADVTAHNLAALDATLDYASARGIHLFRVSSDIVPFASSPVNTLDWRSVFAEDLAALGEKARRYGIRLSMHPGQYTVLNSPDPSVVERACADLAYHCSFLDALGLDASCKLVLHIGGAYGNKGRAIERFAASYEELPDSVKRRLVVENDDRLFTASDVLAVSRMTGAPVVFDVLHHEINPGTNGTPMLELIDQAAATWKVEDGKQKIHYSQQAPGRKPGSHSDTVAIDGFLDFFRSLDGRELDIMLEVKDKNLSAVKCIACTDPAPHIAALEAEWARYKYVVLEHDQAIYQAIRRLLKNKEAYPAVEFYELVERALATPANPGSFRNAASHVWGYVSDLVDEREKRSLEKLMARFEADDASSDAVKRSLAKLAEKYDQAYLLDSYYFVL